jgi:L-malate glycosyltransferase
LIGLIQSLVSGLVLNELDILANISEYESFGVSVIEAMACKIPVIVSNTAGLIEVVKNSDNAIIINQNQPVELAEAFEKIMNDKLFAKTHTDSAYLRVCQEYNWTYNLKQMTTVYDTILKSKTIGVA